MFEPVIIGGKTFVDGGVVSPVPVDAARQLGAEFVIAVDISSKASGQRPTSLLGAVNQSIAIMGQRLGEQELARADVVIRPAVLDIGAADFEQRGRAILEGEKAATAAMPQIRAGIARLQQARAQQTPSTPVPVPARRLPRPTSVVWMAAHGWTSCAARKAIASRRRIEPLAGEWPAIPPSVSDERTGVHRRPPPACAGMTSTVAFYTCVANAAATASPRSHPAVLHLHP